MSFPTGTFMAKARGGTIEFPPPIRRYCEVNRWTLFHVAMLDGDRLEIQPVLPGDQSVFIGTHHASLSSDGRLWIPVELRELVSLGEQSVMMRIENERIRIYLRNVFKTLGFGP